MMETLKNVVVVGGSYVGRNTAKELAATLPPTHRVLLVEPHSHFHHLFAFPRFAIVPNHEHKAFVPYTKLFSALPGASRHAVVQARVVSLSPSVAHLDREWQGSRELPFEYLVAATGTRLAAPGTVPHDDKASSVGYLQSYQQCLKRANRVVIIGGGAVGVQMACDLKEFYPDKQITLVHSRDQLMPVYAVALSELIKERFKDLGINFITGSRAVVPPNGFPNDGQPFDVELLNGTKVAADYVVLATGQTPNTEFLRGLEPSGPDSLLNPRNGFIRVRPTMQFQDPRYPQLYAVGDIADSGAHKAARPGMAQAAVVARNIAAVAEGREPVETIEITPPAIHLTLGLKKNVIFRNTDRTGGSGAIVNLKDDGTEDMNVESIWTRQGLEVKNTQEFHL